MDFLCFKKEIVVCFSIVFFSSLLYAANNTTSFVEKFIFKKRGDSDISLLDNNLSKYEYSINKIKSQEENDNIVSVARTHINFLKNKKTQATIDKMKKNILARYDINLSEYNVTDISATSSDIFPKNKYFLCISSSMPIELIQNYLQQIESQNKNIEVVMNGFIGGIKKVKKTVAFMNKILIKNKHELYDVKVQINPKIFMYYNIKVVPALILDLNFDKRLTSPLAYIDNNNSNFTVVYGASSLKAMIREVGSIVSQKSK